MAHINKRIGPRGTSYTIRVSCGYTANGEQVRKSMTWKPEPGMTEKQAEKAVLLVAADFERKVQRGDTVDASTLKLSDFCQDYLKLKKSSLAPTTLAQYERVIREHIVPELGHMKLQNIRPIHVQHFIEKLADPAAVPKLSANSVTRYFNVLKSIMAQAYKLELIDSNPTETTRITLPRTEEKEVEVFTREESAHVLECLQNEPIMWQALINIAIVTGARRGEIVALQWEDIDLQRRTISIKRSNYKLAGDEIRSKEPKTKKSVRTVTIDEYTAAILNEWHKAQMLERIKLGDLWKPGNWLFTQWDGAPMYPSSPTLWWDKFQKRHGIPHHKFHALRHTSGTFLLASGTNIKTVASRLGHTQLSTVNRYIHALEEADKAAANTFDALRPAPIPIETAQKQA